MIFRQVGQPGTTEPLFALGGGSATNVSHECRINSRCASVSRVLSITPSSFVSSWHYFSQQHSGTLHISDASLHRTILRRISRIASGSEVCRLAQLIWRVQL